MTPTGRWQQARAAILAGTVAVSVLAGPGVAVAAESSPPMATLQVIVEVAGQTHRAALTQGQAADLASRPGVRVELDRPVAADLAGDAALDLLGLDASGAATMVGADVLRRELGLTGRAAEVTDGLAARDAVVAVIDSGIDASHPAFAGDTIRAFEDFVGQVDGCPAPPAGAYDDAGHGTHVASVIAGHGGGVVGIAPGAGLVGLKVLDCNGQGNTSDVIAALDWVLDNRGAHGIDAVNISLGDSVASDGTDLLSRAVNRVVAAGVVVTLSAGNAGSQRNTIGSPGSAAWGITVGAVADASVGGTYLAAFSGRGPTLDGRMKPDVVAPGVGIVGARAGGGTVMSSGTSMAAPVVAAIAAVLVEADQSLRPSGAACDSCPTGVSGMKNPLADLLRNTAEDHGAVGADVDFGHGVVNARAAAARALGVSLSARQAPCTGATSTRRGTSVAFFSDGADFAVAGTFLSDAPFEVEVVTPSGQTFELVSGEKRQLAFVLDAAPAGEYRVDVLSGTSPVVIDLSGVDSVDGVAARCPAGVPANGTSLTSLPTTCRGEGDDTARFADVATGTSLALAVECIAQTGVTAGMADGTFRPEGDVTRAQLATFLVRALAAAGHELPAGPDAFQDDNGSVHEANINALAAAGIVGGRGNGQYDPSGRVSRAQMAAFLVRTHDRLTGQTAIASTDHFQDDDGQALEASINRSADLGIMQGATATTFEGHTRVLRGPMASYLARILVLATDA